MDRRLPSDIGENHSIGSPLSGKSGKAMFTAARSDPLEPRPRPQTPPTHGREKEFPSISDEKSPFENLLYASVLLDSQEEKTKRKLCPESARIRTKSLKVPSRDNPLEKPPDKKPHCRHLADPQEKSNSSTVPSILPGTLLNGDSVIARDDQSEDDCFRLWMEYDTEGGNSIIPYIVRAGVPVVFTHSGPFQLDTLDADSVACSSSPPETALPRSTSKSRRQSTVSFPQGTTFHSANLLTSARDCDRETATVTIQQFVTPDSAPRIRAHEKSAPSHRDKSKQCRCQKSKCLLLYCECFAAKELCHVATCKCTGCSNTSLQGRARKRAIEKVLHKDEFAFHRTRLTRQRRREVMLQRKLSKRECKCQKSRCLKRYCECYFAGVRCNELCGCQDCRNQP